MADIQTITKLREMTGAGMMDCKKALDESSNDFDKAVEILRKKGEAKSAKKADRATKEGVVAMAEKDGKVAVVSIACETDFVSQNEDFIKTVQDYAEKLLDMDIQEFKDWVEQDIKNVLVLKIGENIKLVDADVYSADTVNGSYIHSNKKIGSVVALSGGTLDLAKDIAMHATAMSPDYLKPEDVPAEVIEKEKEIYSEQLRNEGKSEEMIEKIMAGKLNKFYEEVCLVNQAFIKDDKKKVSDLLKEAGDVEIKAFKIFKI